MRYKAGDKVKIRKDLNLYKHYPMISCKSYMPEFKGFHINNTMLAMAGRTVEIESVYECYPYEGCYLLVGYPFTWTDTMFEDCDKTSILFTQLL